MSVAEEPGLAAELEGHRRELTGYCYRMLGSVFEAEDAVQETMIRAWRGHAGFEGRSALRSWLYRIATNVSLDMLDGRARRARPMDLAGPRPHDGPIGGVLPETTWLEPFPDAPGDAADPAAVVEERETLRLAFVAALQHLPPRQRAVLILREVLRWQASEVAELLETSVAAVNSSLQRARATLETAAPEPHTAAATIEGDDRELLDRYVDAFERYDLESLTALIAEDARQSMPPYELWLQGRDQILGWWWGVGIGCKGSRVLPAPTTANGLPAYGQYKPDPAGGFAPWALQVVEVREGRIAELTFFLDAERLFPLFDLPPRIDG